MRTPSAAEIEYLTALGRIKDNYAEVLMLLGAQWAAAAADTGLLADAGWQLATTSHLVALKLQGETLRKLGAPTGCKWIHAAMRLAARHFDEVPRYYVRGELGRAEAEIQHGSAGIHRAFKLIARRGSGGHWYNRLWL